MRKIPMNDFLCKLLLEAKKHSKGSYVVQKAYGGRITETAWKRLFESYMEALRKAYGAGENNLCFADISDVLAGPEGLEPSARGFGVHPTTLMWWAFRAFLTPLLTPLPKNCASNLRSSYTSFYIES